MALRLVARCQRARWARSPRIATAVRTETLSASWTAEPQASVQLPNATDTPMSDAVGMVVTEMPNRDNRARPGLGE